jgi:hypothetical protein
VGQQSGGYRWFGLRANEAVNKFSVLEDEHGGNALNLKLSGCAWVFVHIQLGYAVTTIRLGG